MNDDGTLHDCYILREVSDGLIAAVRAALRRPAIDPDNIMQLGGFLRLVLQLPKCDLDQSASLSFSLDTGEGEGDWRASFGDEGLHLSTSETLRGTYGADYFSKTIFRATPDACNTEDDLEDWLWNFKRMAEDADYTLSAWCEPLDGITT
jgi:hypothetical protein